MHPCNRLSSEKIKDIVGTKDVVAVIHFVFFIFVIWRDLSLDFGALTSVAYAYLQDLEGYCRDPGFDQNKVRDSGKRTMFRLDTGLACY